LVRFLKVLFERDRLVALSEIAESFQRLADQCASVIPVEISTARPISPEEVGRIETRIEQSLSGTPEFHWKVDPALLGGIVVTFEGKVLDGSLNGRLNKLERTLRY
jgi:F-type H+-transporting ATPase subunit delta